MTAAVSTVGGSVVEGLRAAVRGVVLAPGDEGYETARKVWNGMIDRRPAAIVRCSGAADVVATVRAAREVGALVSVRGGGHNVAGSAVCDGGIMIDLSAMRGVRVDASASSVRVQGGATWGDLDRETQQFGLATTGGMISTTGIAGLTLGGGIGWLMRRDGLACDRLVSADVVMADGRLLTASAQEHPDLFWGLRGGGGNFGIVTSFEYRLAPLSLALAGLALFPQARARELLSFFREFAATAPDDLTAALIFLTAPPAPFIPQQLQGTRMVALALCHAAGPERGEADVRPVRALNPAVDLIGPMPYCALQSMFDEGAPAGLQYYFKSSYLSRLDDAAIEALATGAEAMRSPLSQLHVQHLQGAVSRVGADETAFSHRTAPFVFNAIGTWADPAEGDSEIAWARGVWQSLQPASAGAYANFLGDEGADRVRAAYSPATYARLALLKAAYDPDNFFRLNQNIAPAR